MTSIEMIADLVSRGYGVFIDPGDDGVDEQDRPFRYHVAVTSGEWDGLSIEMGMYSHDWEEALREVWEGVRCLLKNA